jgi:hypothetical protein
MACPTVFRFGPLAMVLCLATPMAAYAEDTDSFGGRALKPGETHDGRIMTVDELVACIDLQGELRERSRKADSLEMDADLSESRYRGLAQIIGAERRTLDPGDQHAIDAFNAKVHEHGAAVDAYNVLVVALNKALDDQTMMANRFNDQCSASTYRSSDLVKAYSIRERRLAASMERGASKETNKP